MFGFTIKDIIIAAAAALVAGFFAFVIGRIVGNGEGYDKRIAEVAIADAKAELERKGEDEKLQGMSDYDLCIHALDGRGGVRDACEQLRGVHPE